MSWLSRNLMRLAVNDWHTQNIPTADSADNDHVADVVGNKTDTVGGNSITALVKIMQADLDNATDGLGALKTSIDNIQSTQPVIISRTASVLPQTAQTAYFTVTGRVLLVNIVGEVTTVIQTLANATKLVANPTVGADVDLCAVNDITADAVGTLYNITGTLADAMIATTSGAMKSQAANIVVTAGTIDLNCAASATGETKWVLHYVPLDAGSVIVVA